MIDICMLKLNFFFFLVDRKIRRSYEMAQVFLLMPLVYHFVFGQWMVLGKEDKRVLFKVPTLAAGTSTIQYKD